MKRILIALFFLLPSLAMAQVTNFLTSSTLRGTQFNGTLLPGTCVANQRFHTTTDNLDWIGQGSPCVWVQVTGTLPSIVTQNMSFNGTVTHGGDTYFLGVAALPYTTSLSTSCVKGEVKFIDGDNGLWRCNHPELAFPANWDQVGGLQHADESYLGERPSWKGASQYPFWFDVPLRSSRILIKSIQILTTNRNWTAVMCESRKSPSRCSMLVGPGSSTGWNGDFTYSENDLNYEDRDGADLLHLYFVPDSAKDWMHPRVRLDYEVH